MNLIHETQVQFQMADLHGALVLNDGEWHLQTQYLVDGSTSKVVSLTDEQAGAVMYLMITGGDKQEMYDVIGDALKELDRDHSPIP